VHSGESIRLAFGAENLADEYPESVPPATINTTGNNPFTNYAPFGLSGRYVCARATFECCSSRRQPGAPS
jgi:iron complex outermembrane recepter protein